jgi:TetR/AcrR family transcriptional regulator, transcriptional repressor for nem operon
MPAQSEPRERILKAALELFRTKGYHAVGTQEICERAEVLKGTLYHFFPTKIDVAIAVLENYRVGSTLEIAEATGQRFKPARRLAGLFDLEYQCAKDQLVLYGFVTGCFHNTMAMELTTTEPRARDVLERITAAWAKTLEPTIQDLIDTSVIPKCDIHAASKLVLALLSGSTLIAKLHNDPEIIPQMGRSVLRLLGGTKLLTKMSKVEKPPE